MRFGNHAERFINGAALITASDNAESLRFNPCRLLQESARFLRISRVATLKDEVVQRKRPGTAENKSRQTNDI